MNKEESIQPQLYVGFNVFKLSIDYEELLKETNQIPAVIIRCLQRVRKVRFTVVKAQIFLTLTYMIDWLHNFDFNFINHSNLKEDIWELVFFDLFRIFDLQTLS